MYSNGDILSVVKPFFAFCNCHCLSFFSLEDGKIIVSKSKASSSIIILILCLIFKFLSLFWYTRPPYEVLIINFTTLMFMAFCLVSFLNCLIHGRSIAKLWNEIIPLASFIKEVAFYRKTFRVVCFQLIGFNAICVTFLIMYYFFISISFNEKLSYLTVFSDYCMLAHFYVTGTFFSGGLYYGAKLISVANEELAKLKEIEYYRNCKAWEGPDFARIKKMKNLRSQLKMIKHEDLSPLVDIYEKLCQCFENLNDCFGASLTATCLNSAMEMTLSCYFIIKHGWSGSRLFSFWFMYCFITDWTLLHACEKFVKEAQKSRQLVDLIVTESSSRVLQDSVQRFSRHLLHRKIKFTACRLFDLDYQFLYSVLMNTITYLVIVVQFDSSQKANS